MSTVPFFIVDSFTKNRFAGNPAGVVLLETPLAKTLMQTIAGELHLETAFVSSSTNSDVDYQVAYYTSAGRVPLCGHDTIALATVLVQIGRLLSPGVVRLATDVGVLAVQVDTEGVVTMQQALPRFRQTVPADGAAAALGLPLAEIEATGLPVQIVSTGTPFLVVPIVHRAVLNALAPDWAALTAYGQSLPDAADGFYLWTPDTENSGVYLHARCFAPAIDLPEDPVTGTASGAVGAYLVQHGVLFPDTAGRLSFRTEQGYAMGRPGTVQVCLEMRGTEIVSVEVSGVAVLTGQGTLFV